MDAVARVLASSRFVLGPEGQALETELAALAGVRHGMGVGSGTDALRLALTAVGVGPGDEVVTPAFSFVASASTIVMAGAQPVFVDIDPATFALDPDALESALTRAHARHHAWCTSTATRAPSTAIAEIARAPRRGRWSRTRRRRSAATWDGRPIGGWGDVACLSFYPTKNLGACGDAGMLLTNRDDVAEHVAPTPPPRRHRPLSPRGARLLQPAGRDAGRDAAGQAAPARGLERGAPPAGRPLPRRGWPACRSALPAEHPRAQAIYHQFVVRHPQRDALAKVLADLGVGTMVHYPLPVPGQPLFGLDGEKRWPQAWRAAARGALAALLSGDDRRGDRRRGRRRPHRAGPRVTRRR